MVRATEILARSFIFMRRSITSLAVAAALLLGGPALAAPDQQEVIDRAKATLEGLRGDVSYGNAPELLKRAKAVMIVPQLIKGGFFIGGEGGTGVLLGRGADSWSYPAFYTVAAASFGLQIGFETAEVVLLVMSDRALAAWMDDEFKLGAKAGLTVLMLGSNAEAAATTNINVDVIAWARSRGAYAGVTLEGSLIKPREAYNEAYYGKRIHPRDILRGEVQNPDADLLRRSLAAVPPENQVPVQAPPPPAQLPQPAPGIPQAQPQAPVQVEPLGQPQPR
jgi:lipid-binding SYLF domain-containing protein